MRQRRWVALAAALAALAGCGERSTATRLTIEHLDASGVHAYRVECDPPGGTAANAIAICGELRRHPSLLADVPALSHSCPPDSPSAVRVTGTYRGHSIRAEFPGARCNWVFGPDQLASWSFLLRDAGQGRHEADFIRVPLSGSERERKSADARQARQSWRAVRELMHERTASGSTRLDGQALRIIRELTALGSPFGGAAVESADVYATSLRKADRAMGERSFEADRPVFVVVYHLVYRDYAGGRHRGTAALSVLDALTFEPRTLGLVVPGVRALGHPVTLTF